MGMVSTVAGQRRILKRNITVIEFIRRAVESGVYRTPEEMAIIRKQRQDGVEDLRTIMTRLRQDVVRGSLIQDYPREYLIMEQHPPIPDPLRTPKRILRQLKPPSNNALQQLTKKYVQQYAQQTKASVLSNPKNDVVDPDTGGPLTSDEYYRRLLGVQKASSSSSMYGSKGSASASSFDHTTGGPTLYQKPVLLQKAYSAALLHHQLSLRQQQQPHDATMAQVDDMLSQQVAHEQSVARARRNTIQTAAAAAATTSLQVAVVSDHAASRRRRTTTSPSSPTTSRRTSATNAPFPFAKLRLDGTTTTPTTETPAIAAAADDDDSSTNHHHHHPTLQSIFHSDPNTIEGMMRWSERLQAVPYAEWTIGAATALDHWIARQVLQLSELTWQATLEGDNNNAATYYLSLGRDIVACREAIFPETKIHLPSRRMEEEEATDLEDQWSSVAGDTAENVVDDDPNLFGMETTKSPPSSLEKVNETRSIEDLLQRLGGLRSPDAISEPFSADQMTTEIEEDATDRSIRISRLVNELQNWRRRNMEVPYDQWEPIDQDKFFMWMKRYVATLSSEAEKRQERSMNQTNRRDMMIDYDATRIALLADPPVSAEESNEFWNQLQDESMVEILLDNMIEDGPPPGASILHESFWELPRKTQLHQLLNLGAVRPLLDEYTKETDRLRFLRRYGDAILTGVPLEHLVPDPAGPIKASDLSRELVSSLRIGEQERFRLEKLPYQGLANVNDRQRQQDAFEKSRLLYKAWNEHKSGRARYEEKLFQTGRLGLRYNDELDINAKATNSSHSADTTPPKRRR